MGVRLVAVIAATVIVLASPTSVLVAQSAGRAKQLPRFEVASVKLHTADDQPEMMVAQPGGRFVAVNVPLRHVIRTAFQLQNDQIVGGPDWLATDRFDIEARAAGMPGAPSVELLAMLQSLLTDRFKLTTHREMRELPVFALERVRRDRALGAGLRPTICPELAIDLKRPKPCANMSTGPGSLTARNMPFSQLMVFLSPYLNRVLVDRTGLDGRYDVDLKWLPQQADTAVAPPSPPGGEDRASLFTAVQEQLGLKLESTMGTVEVLVIDSVAHPAPN